MAKEFEGSRIFLNIPVEVAHDPRIKSDKSILLFGEIYSMLNVTGSFFMSNKKIAKRIRAKSIKTVQNCLDELESLGYIKRQVIRDPETNAVIKRKITSDWHPGVTDYTRGVNSNTRGSCNQIHDPGVTDYTIKEHSNRSIKKTNINSALPSNAQCISQLEAEFEEVWSDYPNKKGKKQAFNHYKSWRKESTNHTNAYLIKKLKQYLIYCQQNSWYHPMNGSTWFNGRFDDELEITPQTKPKRIFN